jgi:sporulation protein YlmC with PRC-barrel domain
MLEKSIILPGTKVIGSDWNDIGEVKDLIFDRDTTRISKLVIQINTFYFGCGCKVLDIGEVNRFLDSGKIITLYLTRDMVEALPDFKNTYQF